MRNAGCASYGDETPRKLPHFSSSCGDETPQRNTCRFLDLPVELQQEIYERCDVHSRLRLDHVLKNKFKHKMAINQRLLLIAYALKRDRSCVSTNVAFNTFLSQNRSDGSVRCLVDEYGITLEELDDFNALCKSVREGSMSHWAKLLTVEVIEVLNDKHLQSLTIIIYQTSVAIFESLWDSVGGRLLLQKTVFINNFELRMFCFGVINYGNCELAKHIFSIEAQNKYGIMNDVSTMKDYIMTNCVDAFADRVSCLKVMIECCEPPMEILHKCLKVAMNTIAVDAFRFLRERGVTGG